MVRFVAVQRPRDVAAQHKLLEAVHDGAHRQAALEPVLEIAVLVELGVQPTLFECFGVSRQLVVLAPGGHGGKCGVTRQHTGFDGGMAALDAAGVQKAGVATYQRAAREYGLGQRRQAAGVDGAGAIGQALGRDFTFVVFKVVAHVRVRLPALEFFERAQVRVVIAQAGDEAQRDLVALHVVQKGTTVGVLFHGPAGAVQHKAGLVAAGVDLPQFFHADGKALRVLTVIQLELGNQLLAQVAARAFGKHGVLAQQFHAELKVVTRLAVFANAHVAGGHAFD